jgi:hypothetical protein
VNGVSDPTRTVDAMHVSVSKTAAARDRSLVPLVGFIVAVSIVESCFFMMYLIGWSFWLGCMAGGFGFMGAVVY